MTEATPAVEENNKATNKERNNNSESIAVEKDVDKKNTETSAKTTTSEVRDNVCMMKSTDIMCCGTDHLNDQNILKSLIDYPNR